MADIGRFAVGAASLAYFAMLMMGVLALMMRQVIAYLKKQSAGYSQLAKDAVESAAAIDADEPDPLGFLAAITGSAEASGITEGGLAGPMIQIGIAGVFAMVVILCMIMCVVITGMMLVDPVVESNPKVLALVQAALGMQTVGQAVGQLAVIGWFRKSGGSLEAKNTAHAIVSFAVYTAAAGMLTEAAAKLRELG